MLVPFHKMHGAGNDFVIFDARGGELGLSPAQRRLLADRRTGIGCDQLIVLERPRMAGAAVFMRIYNPDGSESGTCGNATRCVAVLLGAETGQGALAIETAAGMLQAEILRGGVARVDMGPPGLDWRDIPLSVPCDTRDLPLPGSAAGCSMGNPHATVFVAELDEVAVAVAGPALENDPLFPNRANIGFAQIISPTRIRLCVWERGAGRTLACGSGACAALVAAHRRGLTGRVAEVVLDGGTLGIEWRESDGHVLMTGPTAYVFHGTFDFSTTAA